MQCKYVGFVPVEQQCIALVIAVHKAHRWREQYPVRSREGETRILKRVEGTECSDTVGIA